MSIDPRLLSDAEIAYLRTNYQLAVINGHLYIPRLLDHIAALTEERDKRDQVVAEACAKVCESRAESLFHDSHNITASGEARKCAAALRWAWPQHDDPPRHVAMLPQAKCRNADARAESPPRDSRDSTDMIAP